MDIRLHSTPGLCKGYLMFHVAPVNILSIQVLKAVFDGEGSDLLNVFVVPTTLVAITDRNCIEPTPQLPLDAALWLASPASVGGLRLEAWRLEGCHARKKRYGRRHPARG